MKLLPALLRWLGRPRALALCFVLCALPAGLGIALLAPIGMAPDEIPATVRADALRLGQIRAIQAPGVFPAFHMNTSIFMVLTARETYDAERFAPVPASDLAQERNIAWYGNTIDCPSQMAEYFPIFYAPGALGLQLGRSAEFSPLHSVYLGRVAMLLAYVAMGAAALALARQGGALMFAVLTLPPSLAMAGSYNQDGGMLACCALAAALLTREGKARAGVWAGLAAVAAAKLPYLPLLGLGLAPLREPGLWRRLLGLGLACVLPLLWFLHLRHGGFVPYARPPYHPGPFWPGDRSVNLSAVQPGYNLPVLAAHPLALLWLPAASLVSAWSWLWPHLFCMTAYDSVKLGGADWPLAAAALLWAMCGAIRRPGRPEDAGLAGAALFAAFSSIELSLYLTFTHAGADRIDGVQARYFLPLLPFLALVLPSLARLPGFYALARLPQGVFALPALALAGANIAILPGIIFHLFRIPGP